MTKLNNFVLNEIEAQMSLTKNADMQTWKMGTTLLVLMIVSITSIITQKSAILQGVAKSCPSRQNSKRGKALGQSVSQEKEELEKLMLDTGCKDLIGVLRIWFTELCF